MKTKTEQLLIHLLLPLAIGCVSWAFVPSARSAYSLLARPDISPPYHLLFLAWMIFFLVLGMATHALWNHTEGISGKIMTLYTIYLLLAAAWPLLFFDLSNLLLALICSILLIIVGIISLAVYYRENNQAGYLFLLCFIWSLYSGYLNLIIYIAN